MAVAEVEPEEMGVRGRIVGGSGGGGAPGTARRCGLPLLTAPRTLAVEPIADGSAREPEVTADVAESNAGLAKIKSASAYVGRMHPLIVEQGYDTSWWCRGRESNPHALSDGSF